MFKGTILWRTVISKISPLNFLYYVFYGMCCVILCGNKYLLCTVYSHKHVIRCRINFYLVMWSLKYVYCIIVYCVYKNAPLFAKTPPVFTKTPPVFFQNKNYFTKTPPLFYCQIGTFNNFFLLKRWYHVWCLVIQNLSSKFIYCIWVIIRNWEVWIVRNLENKVVLNEHFNIAKCRGQKTCQFFHNDSYTVTFNFYYIFIKPHLKKKIF